ncbi:hypothetical protein SAMN04487983_103370 [Streptomyces sp. yr375]|uniref:hypothetical protein n=1 Tax=Streptomyces sp. yr375 TaxID=1761906 RepID=UPI0008C394E3|nr:hypothetical protein [Streptomyces sp. yr375]SES16264.1 hypothetical protein SAMN04487983_103370 [Streptomyces sp. yr375]
MGQARLGDDGGHYDDLPCRWCGALVTQDGRRRPRLYCGGWHRTKTYCHGAFMVIAGLF